MCLPRPDSTPGVTLPGTKNEVSCRCTQKCHWQSTTNTWPTRQHTLTLRVTGRSHKQGGQVLPACTTFSRTATVIPYISTTCACTSQAAAAFSATPASLPCCVHQHLDPLPYHDSHCQVSRSWACASQAVAASSATLPSHLCCVLLAWDHRALCGLQASPVGL